MISAVGLALVAGTSLPAQTPVAMKNVELQATLRAQTREIDGVIRVSCAHSREWQTLTPPS